MSLTCNVPLNLERDILKSVYILTDFNIADQTTDIRIIHKIILVQVNKKRQFYVTGKKRDKTRVKGIMIYGLQRIDGEE